MYMYSANMHPYEQDAYQVIVHASKVIEWDWQQQWTFVKIGESSHK